MELLSPEGLRQDGRRPRELRKLEFRPDVLGNADGSAVFELGNTKVGAVLKPAVSLLLTLRHNVELCRAMLVQILHLLQVLAAVYGPRAARGRAPAGRTEAAIRCEFAIAAFSQSKPLVVLASVMAAAAAYAAP